MGGFIIKSTDENMSLWEQRINEKIKSWMTINEWCDRNGLTSLVSLKFRLDPYSGTSVFLFCNKRHNSLRALRWDKNGFILITKLLGGDMKFQWPKNEGDIRDITKHQMEWLLEGLQVD